MLPARFQRSRSMVAVGVAAVTAILTLKIGLAGAVGTCGGRWLRADGLSRLILLSVGVGGFLIAVYSLAYMSGRERLREYYAYLLWTVGFSCGAALAGDLVLLLVFWGLLGMTLYLLVGIGGPDASAAAKKSFIIIGGSDCLLLLGVVIFRFAAGTTRVGAGVVAVSDGLTAAAFLCFVAAAFAKAGCMPLHSWVPDCGDKAPVTVTALLPASLDKLVGIYLLVRAVRDLFVLGAGMKMLLMFCGAASIVCAVMMALVQHDLKRLLSYHAVSQVGYMVLGIGSGTVIGLAGALFHMLNNAIYKTCLFLCAGAVERRAGTTDLDKLGGLWRSMPLTFGSCFVAAMAISGLPPLNGFYSKWMVYQGIVVSGEGGVSLWPLWLAAAMAGSALTLASFVKVLHAVFLRRAAPGMAEKAIKEAEPAMTGPSVFLAALCVLFGVMAVRLPIAKLIAPAVGGEIAFLGRWSAGMSAVLLFAAFALGLVIYAVTSVRKPRECPTYTGGEVMDEVEISGAPRGRDRDLEVTGIDFYETVEELSPFRQVYGAARRKWFDVYELGARGVFYLVESLRAAHSGRLTTYLTWLVAGFLVLMWVLWNGGGTPTVP